MASRNCRWVNFLELLLDGTSIHNHDLFRLNFTCFKCSYTFHQVMCTVEDDKVSIEELSEKIEEFEDFVQSCDVNAMNKI